MVTVFLIAHLAAVVYDPYLGPSVALQVCACPQRIQTLLKQGLQQDPDFEKRWPEVLGTFLEDQPKRP